MTSNNNIQETFLYIDSRNRDHGENHSLTYKLRKAYKLKKVQVVDVILPNTYLPINQTNCRFEVVTAGGSNLIDIRYGSYSGTALASQIQDQMNLDPGDPTYAVTYDLKTRKFKINANPGKPNFFLNFDYANSAFKILGFDRRTQYPSQPAVGSVYDDEVESNTQAFYTGPDWVYVRMNTCINSDMKTMSNVIAKIPLTSGFDTLVYHQFTDETFTSNETLNEIKLDLALYDGSPFYFGGEWLITLKLYHE